MRETRYSQFPKSEKQEKLRIFKSFESTAAFDEIFQFFASENRIETLLVSYYESRKRELQEIGKTRGTNSPRCCFFDAESFLICGDLSKGIGFLVFFLRCKFRSGKSRRCLFSFFAEDGPKKNLCFLKS